MTLGGAKSFLQIVFFVKVLHLFFITFFIFHKSTIREFTYDCQKNTKQQMTEVRKSQSSALQITLEKWLPQCNQSIFAVTLTSIYCSLWIQNALSALIQGWFICDTDSRP